MDQAAAEIAADEEMVWLGLSHLHSVKAWYFLNENISAGSRKEKVAEGFCKELLQLLPLLPSLKGPGTGRPGPLLRRGAFWSKEGSSSSFILVKLLLSGCVKSKLTHDYPRQTPFVCLR